MLRRTVAVTALAVSAWCVSAVPAAAQDEAMLKAAFEGRRITMRLDMPGSSDGVDLRMDASPAIDFKTYGTDIKRYGIALAAGDSVPITLIRVKKDLIEFQIAGGGFGTFGDDTSTSVYLPTVDKSNREKELERRIKNETDRDARRRMERDLDDLRDRRERENRRINAERARLEAEKRDRVADQRLRSGSRFNLRWHDRVPPRVQPDDIMRALAEYVDFRGMDRDSRDSRGPAIDTRQAPDLSRLRKGLLRDDVEQMLGRPVETSDKREGGVVTRVEVFEAGDERVRAEFVEDVLVRYTISSR